MCPRQAKCIYSQSYKGGHCKSPCQTGWASGIVVHGVDDELVETMLGATTALFGTQAVHFSTGNLVREISTVLIDGYLGYYAFFLMSETKYLEVAI